MPCSETHLVPDVVPDALDILGAPGLPDLADADPEFMGGLDVLELADIHGAERTCLEQGRTSPPEAGVRALRPVHQDRGPAPPPPQEPHPLDHRHHVRCPLRSWD